METRRQDRDILSHQREREREGVMVNFNFSITLTFYSLDSYYDLPSQ